MQESTKNIILQAGFDVDNDDVVSVPEIEGLTRDMKKIILNSPSPGREEIRTLVNLFYQIQDIRIAVSEQIRSIQREVSGAPEPNEGNLVILTWVLKSVAATEKGIKDALEKICMSNEVGRWLMSIKGIGPALGAGCLAYFNVEGVNYASNFISYAGLNDNNRPWLGKEKSKKIIDQVIDEMADDGKTITDEMAEVISARTQWKYQYLCDKARSEKGVWSKDKLIKACSKIPYNASLKTHMWKVGKSFEYLKSNENSLYGRLLSERITLEIQKNERGDFKELCEQRLQEKTYGKDTETFKCYSEGKLSLPEINARSRRWVQKIFISHLFEEMYRVRYNKLPARYYALEHCDGHHDEIEPEVPYYTITG